MQWIPPEYKSLFYLFPFYSLARSLDCATWLVPCQIAADLESVLQPQQWSCNEGLLSFCLSWACLLASVYCLILVPVWIVPKCALLQSQLISWCWRYPNPLVHGLLLVLWVWFPLTFILHTHWLLGRAWNSGIEQNPGGMMPYIAKKGQ